MKRFSLIALSMLAALSASAQNSPWTLQDCISYALEHNLTVKRQDLATKQAEVELETAKLSRLPGVNASASQNFSFGRGLSADNTYVNTNTASTGFSLGSSANLFSGFRTEETIRLRALDLESANENLLRAKNDLSMNVAAAYVQ
ncbi:MAG: TolC family protein, partial [Bacteroidales bacterium]|nr:TolC family protein [Bacteroidales bacterium]